MAVLNLKDRVLRVLGKFRNLSHVSRPMVAEGVVSYPIIPMYRLSYFSKRSGRPNNKGDLEVKWFGSQKR